MSFRPTIWKAEKVWLNMGTKGQKNFPGLRMPILWTRKIISDAYLSRLVLIIVIKNC